MTRGTKRMGRSVDTTMRVIGESSPASSRNLPVMEVGRVCLEPGCATHLSRYNDQEYCALHAPMVVPRMRGKVLDD